MNDNRRRVTAAGALLGGLLAAGSAWAVPEGTINLGPKQGLEGRSAVAVSVRTDGETLRVCSSDDGRREPPLADGTALDADPFDVGGARALNPVLAERRGSEIIVSRLPAAFSNSLAAQIGLLVCNADAECNEAGERCLPLGNGRSTCGRAIPVTEVQGYCNAQTGPGNWRDTRVNAGTYVVHFVGETETVNPGNGDTTRYFAVDVLDSEGDSAPGGRVFSPLWQINAHDFAYETNSDFYARADVAALIDGERAMTARVFVIDFTGMQGFRYQLMANRLGIAVQDGQDLDTSRVRRSWCLYGDPDPISGDCETGGPDDVAAFPVPEYRIYLNYPDPAPARSPLPVISNPTFNDEAGSNSISPNGDGVQDEGVFEFVSNIEGTYLIVIDTDGDGVLDPTTDLTLDGEATVGRNMIVWDAIGLDGEPIAPGEYSFVVATITAETHFPMIDIETNRDGFVIWEQAGRAQGRVARRMFWNDLPIRNPDELVPGVLDTLATVLENGSAVPGPGMPRHQGRYWVQGDGTFEAPEEVYDTWVRGDIAIVDTVGCRLCAMPVDELVVGPIDEVGDRDGDGLSDDDEARLGTDPDNPDSDGDGINDGVEALGDTDPNNPDSDGDGLDDGEEDRNANGVVDPGETDPTNPDSDGDGINDGVEVNGANPTDPLDDDSDNDGLEDGVEDANRNGVRDVNETDPNNPDTDADQISDGVEVNGANPTDPLDADSDDDGLTDGQEDADRDGTHDANETDPNNRDSDGGGEPDGSERTNGRNPVDNPNDDVVNGRDSDGDGLDDERERMLGTDPNDPDSDDDGISDGVEVGGQNDTDPNNPDSDGDGLPDGMEDADRDGITDPGETNPGLVDTDGDRIADGVEDANRNGMRDAGETDPTDADTDDDGLLDGIEDFNVNGTRDAGETDPLDPDSDDDDLADGVEDFNGNGRRDADETDPLNPDTDGGGEWDGSERRNGRNPVNDPSDDERVDSDGDGLNDDQEREIGTDPNDPDSDDDGLSDGAEVLEEGTDPNDPDSDDDGLLDGREVNDTGTNPTEADSDRDGLLDGVEVDGNNPTNPNDDDTDDDGILDGQEDANRDGTLDDGETNPNDADSDGDGLTDPDERQRLTDPRDPDTDDDGLADGDEVITHRTDPRDDDTDRDGLSDGIEVNGANPTNPINADTDGDGVVDGQEDANQNGAFDACELNPNNPDTDGDGTGDLLDPVPANCQSDDGTSVVGGAGLSDCSAAPGSPAAPLLGVLLGLACLGRRRR